MFVSSWHSLFITLFYTVLKLACVQFRIVESDLYFNPAKEAYKYKSPQRGIPCSHYVYLHKACFSCSFSLSFILLSEEFDTLY